MRILRKFACGCFVLVALTFLGSLLFQISAIENPSQAQGSSSIAGNALIQMASAQADSVYRQASVEIAPNLKSFAASSGAFVHSNATTARLQFEGMTNSLPSLFAVNDWLPRSAPYWSQEGVEGAIQASSSQAMTLSNKFPVVKAVKSSVGRLTEAHPVPNSVGSTF
jgi:hypothetical protein